MPELRHFLNDRSRKALDFGNEVIVPLKFDKDGDVLTEETFDPRKHLRRLNLQELAFLKEWRSTNWDTAKACELTQTSEDDSKRLIRKLQIFKDEEDHIKALADIPTTPWIAAKHVENVYDGKLDDSKRDSLKELSKIVGAYKPTTNIQVQAHILQMPELSPEQAKAAREFFDTIAVTQEPNAA